MCIVASYSTLVINLPIHLQQWPSSNGSQEDALKKVTVLTVSPQHWPHALGQVFVRLSD